MIGLRGRAFTLHPCFAHVAARAPQRLSQFCGCFHRFGTFIPALHRRGAFVRDGCCNANSREDAGYGGGGKIWQAAPEQRLMLAKVYRSNAPTTSEYRIIAQILPRQDETASAPSTVFSSSAYSPRQPASRTAGMIERRHEDRQQPGEIHHRGRHRPRPPRAICAPPFVLAKSVVAEPAASPKAVSIPNRTGSAGKHPSAPRVADDHQLQRDRYRKRQGSIADRLPGP